MKITESQLRAIIKSVLSEAPRNKSRLYNDEVDIWDRSSKDTDASRSPAASPKMVKDLHAQFLSYMETKNAAAKEKLISIVDDPSDKKKVASALDDCKRGYRIMKRSHGSNYSSEDYPRNVDFFFNQLSMAANLKIPTLAPRDKFLHSMKIRIGALKKLVKEAILETEDEQEVSDVSNVRPVSDEEGTLVPESIVRKTKKR